MCKTLQLPKIINKRPRWRVQYGVYNMCRSPERPVLRGVIAAECRSKSPIPAALAAELSGTYCKPGFRAGENLVSKLTLSLHERFHARD